MSFSGIGFDPLASIPQVLTSFENDIFLTGTSDLTCSASVGHFLASDLDCFSEIIVGFTFFDEEISFDTSADFELMSGLLLQATRIFSVSNFVDSLGGLSFNNSRQLAVLSTIARLSGFGYFRDFTIDASCDFDSDFIYTINMALSLDTEVDITSTEEYIANIDFNLTNTSDFDFVSIQEQSASRTLNAGCIIFLENFFDFLIVENVFSSFNSAELRETRNSDSNEALSYFFTSTNCVFSRTVTDTLAIQQVVVGKRPTGFFVQSLPIIQSILLRIIRNRLVTQQLTLMDFIIATREIVDDLIMFDNIDFVLTKNINVTQTLTLSQGNISETQFNRVIVQTLELELDRLIRLPFEYYNTPIQFALKPKKCLVILSVPGRSIVLPCPLFGDSEANTGSMVLKRSITGQTWTYVKRSRTNTLSYTFNLWSEKWYELRDFILNYNAQMIKMYNWKGETWLTYLTNNPIEGTADERQAPRGEKYTVRLQFEGVKING
jgi:hypothetical protein